MAVVEENFLLAHQVANLVHFSHLLISFISQIISIKFSEVMNINTEGPHQVDFLVPFKNAVPVEECSLDKVAGLLRFAGSVSALAYLGPKESISEAISDLKGDIITSLRSRFGIILDAADDDSTTNDLENSPSQDATQVIFHELREPYGFLFPRRVLIPWLSGAYVCDYLQQSETTEDVKERCKEVISLETDVGNSSVIEAESVAGCATLQTFWDVVPGASSLRVSPGSDLKDSRSGETDDSRRIRGANLNILAALFALLVALIFGSVLAFSAR